MCDMKNVTLAIPEDLLKKSRDYAKRHGTTLNEMIRTLLKRTVQNNEDHPVDRLIEHTKEVKIDTNKWKWNRDEAYEREIFS